eukprot:TRINITY_DN8113_c0_g2_i2.p1 TRINITY_DN8113_c0_g2~~TRINITY_DN8113_c0_g2_i2.p1  ORF type:complete len:253 (-),score=66.39 TRINITY_DN8113_c0_g2_i2:8-766(-)
MFELLLTSCITILKEAYGPKLAGAVLLFALYHRNYLASLWLKLDMFYTSNMCITRLESIGKLADPAHKEALRPFVNSLTQLCNADAKRLAYYSNNNGQQQQQQITSLSKQQQQHHHGGGKQQTHITIGYSPSIMAALFFWSVLITASASLASYNFALSKIQPGAPPSCPPPTVEEEVHLFKSSFHGRGADNDDAQNVKVDSTTTPLSLDDSNTIGGFLLAAMIMMAVPFILYAIYRSIRFPEAVAPEIYTED